MSVQNDPRAEVFAALEGIEGGEALRDSLKAFTDSLVDKQIKSNNELKEAQLKVEELATRAPEVKEVIVEKGGEEIAALKQTVLDMQTSLADKDKTANDLIIKDKFMELTGLRDGPARDKIELAILRDQVGIVNGVPVGIVDGVNIAFSDYVQSVNEANGTELRVKAGGKSEGFAGGGDALAPREAPTTADATANAIEQAGGSMPTML